MWNVKCSKWSTCSSNRMKRNDRKNKSPVYTRLQGKPHFISNLPSIFFIPVTKSCSYHRVLTIFKYFCFTFMVGWATGRERGAAENLKCHSWELCDIEISYDMICLRYWYGFVLWYTWDIPYYIFLSFDEMFDIYDNISWNIL